MITEGYFILPNAFSPFIAVLHCELPYTLKGGSDFTCSEGKWMGQGNCSKFIVLV